MIMKKIFLALMIAMFLCPSLICANAKTIETNASDALWYELSGEDTILTVRLPCDSKDGMNWEFEISNPGALELLTHEVIEDVEGSPNSYVGSFMSTASTENTVSLILRYGTGNPNEAPVAARVLELKISADNVITIVSVLDRNQHADWIEYDEDHFILTVSLPTPQNGSCNWNMSTLNPEFFELITCETEKGFVGSYMSNLEGAGFTELYINNENIFYTVNLFASEAGDLFVEWTEVFTVLTPEAFAK